MLICYLSVDSWLQVIEIQWYSEKQNIGVTRGSHENSVTGPQV